MSNIGNVMEALVRLGRILAGAGASQMCSNDVIGLTPILPMWKAGIHEKDSVVQYEGKPWKCIQAHDSTQSSNWTPDSASSLWSTYHATIFNRALPWQEPTGAHDAYYSGEYMIWKDGKIYQCQADATVYDPEILPDAWAVLS